MREKKELGQVHICLGVRGFPLAHEARFQEYVLNTVLGGTMSSRLFQDIREDRGLAYNVFSSLNSFMDTGYLMVYAATSPESAEQVVRLVQEVFRALKEKAPSEREMKMARDHLKGSLMLSLESSSSRMSNLARQEVYFHRPCTLNEMLDGIDRCRGGPFFPDVVVAGLPPRKKIGDLCIPNEPSLADDLSISIEEPGYCTDARFIHAMSPDFSGSPQGHHDLYSNFRSNQEVKRYTVQPQDRAPRHPGGIG